MELMEQIFLLIRMLRQLKYEENDAVNKYRKETKDGNNSEMIEMNRYSISSLANSNQIVAKCREKMS